MREEVYEKVVTGRSLKDIFGDVGKISDVESYTIHVGSIDGSKDNYIEGSKNGRREKENLYVSTENVNSLKMI